MTILFLLLLVPQRETFYELYESGVSKLIDGRETEAIVDLEKAVAIRPDSKAQARTYSMFTILYTPYYQLTRAYIAEKNYPKAAENLALAYEHGEHTFEGGQLTVDLEILDQFIDNEARLKLLEKVAKPVDGPDFGPLVEKMALQDFGALKKLAEDMLIAFPDHEEVRSYCDPVLEYIEGEQKRVRREQAFNQQIGVLISEAREKDLAEQFPEALTAYGNVLRIDPDNSEAKAGMARAYKRLEEQGKTEQEILELQKTNEENIDVMAKLSRENQAMKAAREASLLELKDLASRPIPKVKERIDVDWIVKPARSLVANIQAKVTSSIALSRVTILLEGEELRSWELSSVRSDYTTPLLSNHPIRKADNVFELRALGIDGKVYSDTYPFSLPPPTNFFSRKIRYVLTVFLAGIATLFFFLTQYRRRKLFRQRFNPYVAGAPILNQKMFYGRDSTLKQILNTLHNNSLMIYGERRIGKTSFLHRLNEEMTKLEDPQYEFIPIFVDLQGVHEQDFFLILDSEIAQVLETRDITLDDPPEPLSARQFISRLRKFINAIKEKCEKKPKLVLLLDEVDVMNGFTEQTNQQLRSVFMKGFAEHIVAVMAGININKNWKSEGSPWYNFFEQIELKPLHKNHADNLIMRPVQGVYNYTNTALERILEITGGKPYLIQKMCLNLVSHILIENRRQVTLEDVNYVFKEIEKEFYGA